VWALEDARGSDVVRRNKIAEGACGRDGGEKSAEWWWSGDSVAQSGGGIKTSWHRVVVG